MRDELTIGEFSRITHVSIRMLRRYHERGLLEPAEVDPLTGYRYYSLAQVPTAQSVRRFRDLGMPVPDPCSDAPAGGRVTATVLPARDVAVVTHTGPHDDIDLSYAVLGTYVAGRGIGAPGPVQEIYQVSPADDPDPASWRTRLAWPVHASPVHAT